MQTPTAEGLEVMSFVLCCCKGSYQLAGADGADEEVVEVRAVGGAVLPTVGE